MKVKQVNGFPSIGTIEEPAIFCFNRNALLSYQVAPIDGGGCTLLQFDDVKDIQKMPLNVDGLSKNVSGPYVSNFAINPWEINELENDEKTNYWKASKPYRWIMSFNDCAVDIIFSKVQIVQSDQNIAIPKYMIQKFLARPAK